MKKLLVISVATLALAACTQERDIVPADSGVTTLTASHVSTRSALQASEGETPSYSILWNAPDSILVGYAGGGLATFTSKNESPAAEATFTGKLPDGSGELCAIYPAEDGNTVEADGTYKIVLHNEQTAVECSYDPIAFPSIAQSESKNLSFLNVFGLLELTVGYEDVTSISFGVKNVSIELRTRSMTRKTADPIVMSVQLVDGVPKIVEIENPGEASGFVLYPPKGSECFKIDTPYYMAVHPIEGWLGNLHPAFWLTHSDGNVTEIVLDGQPPLERSKVHKVKRLFLEDTPEEPEVPEAEAIFLDGNKTISVGESITLVPTINPSNATPVLVWSSDDPETVSVTQEGVITGQKSGRTLVTVTVEGSDPDLQPDLTVSIYVTVVEPDPYNGHEYVDLGLPSGLKWATCNIGATKPEDYGDYFAWAETEPYYESIAADGTASWKEGKEAGYDWPSYSWIKKSFESWEYKPDKITHRIIKYTVADNVYYSLWYNIIQGGESGEEHYFVGDGVSSLGDPKYNYEDDAARKNWGGGWRIPSPKDFQELIDNTNNAWTGNYNETGKAGYVFTSKIDATKSIFLPASGMRANDIIINAKVAGYYWSSSLSDDDTQYAQFLNFSSAYASMNDGDRCYGRTIRPVAN